MTHKIRGVRVQEYAYYVNKLRQNVGFETSIWRQIVTSQRLPTTNEWPQYGTEWNPPMKNFCARHCLSQCFQTVTVAYFPTSLLSYGYVTIGREFRVRSACSTLLCVLLQQRWCVTVHATRTWNLRKPLFFQQIVTIRGYAMTVSLIFSMSFTFTKIKI